MTMEFPNHQAQGTEKPANIIGNAWVVMVAINQEKKDIKALLPIQL